MKKEIRTPRGYFEVMDKTREQMQMKGFGYWFSDGDYDIMHNGETQQAYAIRKTPTLEMIIEEQKNRRSDSGMFGIRACKEAVQFDIKYNNKTLFQLLGEYYERSKNDAFFNRAMILAVWEMINE